MERLVALQAINHSAGTIERGQAFLAQATMAADLLATKQAVREADSPRWLDGLQWPGSTVVCIASGPSLTVEQCERVRAWRDGGPNRRAIVINTSYLLAPWADVLYACDARWWDRYIADVRPTFRGQLWTQDDKALKHDGVRWVKSEALAGLGRRPGVIHQGSNSGYQAINLAWQAGAVRILLVGYDMRHDNGRLHWHGDHPGALHMVPGFADWLSRFAVLADDLKREAVDVVNCTPGSALTVFKKLELTEGLQ
jgi:hypothetical protein